ncbi:MAG: ceramidase domain-containing protein [Bacteroidetes bacterium]|nr:ceramidase domain-containing protein [Bacteroidota bacterium]
MSNAQILRNALWGTGLLFSFALSLDFLFDSSVWVGMRMSQSAITVEYCELNHPERLFHQPINTYSNLIYFFYGLVVIQLAKKDLKFFSVRGANSVRNFPSLSILLAANFIYLSFGSAFFHSSLTWMGQRVDMNATYGLTLSLICIGMVQVFVKKELSNRMQVGFVLGMLLLNAAFLPLALYISSAILLPSLFLVLLLLGISNYLQYRSQRSPLLVILSFVLLAAAIQIRSMDVAKINCDPLSIWQGHALWHFLTASSSLSMYFYFRRGKNLAKLKK